MWICSEQHVHELGVLPPLYIRGLIRHPHPSWLHVLEPGGSSAVDVPLRLN